MLIVLEATWHIETAAPGTGTDHTIRSESYRGCHWPPLTRWRRFPTNCEHSSKARSQPRTRPPGPSRAAGAGPHPRHQHPSHRHPFKLKLLTFPPTDTAPTTRATRPIGAYALDRRAAEAITVRAAATHLLNSDHAASAMVLGDLNDQVEPPPPKSSTARPGLELAPAASTSPTTATVSGCGCGPTHPRSATLLPQLSGTQRTDRPHFVSHALAEISLKTTSPPTPQDRPLHPRRPH